MFFGHIIQTVLIYATTWIKPCISNYILLGMEASLCMHGLKLTHTLTISLQVPEDLLKDITSSVQKLMDDVRFSPAPEAIAYLRLLGAEIGYMKTSDMKKMAETLSMYYHVFIKVLPAQVRYVVCEHRFCKKRTKWRTELKNIFISTKQVMYWPRTNLPRGGRCIDEPFYFCLRL